MTGVRTIDDLRDRCFVDDVTGCWHWRGASALGIGRLYLPALQRVVTVPSAAKRLSGVCPPAGRYCVAKCQNAGCANPEHIVVVTPKRRAALRRALGRDQSSVERAIACRRNGSQYRALSDEQVHEVRTSKETGRALAAKFGTSEQVISRARRGLSYRGPTLSAASVFAWRPAVTDQSEAPCA